VNRGKAMHQMSSEVEQLQLELVLEMRGEAPMVEYSGEAGRAVSGEARSGSDHHEKHLLMEMVVERGNAIKALKRVRRNKGSPIICANTGP
jgi:hypothetical protein